MAHQEQEKRSQLKIALITRDAIYTDFRQYGGPEGNFPVWASNYSLNFLRVKLLKLTTDKE